MRKIIHYIVLTLFFFGIFSFFNLNMVLKLVLSAALSLFFLVVPLVASRINKMHAEHSLKKIRNDAVRVYHITPQEAEVLFYLDKNTNIRINTKQLEKCNNISKKIKEILSNYFESP